MRPRRTPEGDRKRIALPTREGTSRGAEVNGNAAAAAVDESAREVSSGPPDPHQGKPSPAKAVRGTAPAPHPEDIDGVPRSANVETEHASDSFADWQRGHVPSRMLIAGVVLSASSVAVLARRLQRAGQLRLADDVGLALDGDWNELQLAPNEEITILRVLCDCPELLRPLRDALRANVRLRAEGC